MPRTGDTYSPPGGSWNPAVDGTIVSASGWNTLRDDLRDAISESFRRDGGGTMSGQFKAADGSVGAPGISFSGDTDTGIYRTGANALRIATNGTARLEVNAGPNAVQQVIGGTSYSLGRAWLDMSLTGIVALTSGSSTPSPLAAGVTVNSQVADDNWTINTGTGVVTISSTGAGWYRISYSASFQVAISSGPVATTTTQVGIATGVSPGTNVTRSIQRMTFEAGDGTYPTSRFGLSSFVIVYLNASDVVQLVAGSTVINDDTTSFAKVTRYVLTLEKIG